MTEEVTMAQVLQAVMELSQDLKATESRLNDKFDKVEVRITKVEEKVDQVEVKLTEVEKNTIENGEKIDRFDDKLSIVTDELLSTKADVKRLKNLQ